MITTRGIILRNKKLLMIYNLYYIIYIIMIVFIVYNLYL